MERKENETGFVPELEPIKVYEASKEWIPIGGGNRRLNPYHENDLIEGYEILKYCTSGGMGEIYLCRQVYEDAFYILKTIAPAKSTQAVIEAMMWELKRMERIPAHPNVIHIHIARIINDIPHIIMEYAEGVNENGKSYGSSLQDLFENHYKFCFMDVLWIALSICCGLSHCQQNIEGFVHGDIKPGNILFQPLESKAVFEEGLCKYRVMIADFGGGKTQGYYISGKDEAATAEDDIYAFAKTMELLFKAACETGGVNQKNLYYWNQFCAGLKGMLHEEYSSELRKNIDFLSLYNGYAEAFEVAAGLNTYGYYAEDVIPQRDLRIRAVTVEVINDCIRKVSIEGKEDEAEKALLSLLEKTGVEEVYFDDLPAVMVIRLSLVNIYFRKERWEDFSRVLGEMKENLKKLRFPIRYKGFFCYSVDIKTDMEIMEQLAHMRKGEAVDIGRLIAAVRTDVDSSLWLEELLYYITMNDKEKFSILEKQIFSLKEPSGEKNPQLVNYHRIMGSYYWYCCNFPEAYPHYRFLVEMDLDRLEYSFRYALVLYSTGSIMMSMMYFAHAYDIYLMEGSFYNENWYTVKMGLMSLLYMCDYECFKGHYQMAMLFRQDSLDESVRERMDELQEICIACQTLMNKWRNMEKRVLYEENEHNDIREIIWIKEDMRKTLEENKIDASDARHRVVTQIFIESSRALARVYMEVETYDLAIRECNNILGIDQTNFDGYQMRSECYAILWRKSGQEEYRAVAMQDMRAALKYVYASFPGKNGEKSPDAEEWKKKIHKKLEDIGG